MTAQFTTYTESATRLPRSQAPRRNQRVFGVGPALQWLHRVAPRTAGNLVENLFFSPRRLPVPVRFEGLLEEADSFTQLRHGAYTLPVYSWGEGPTVLMVHGWSGGGVQFGAFVKPLVHAGYRVVVFDAPAHGRAQGSQTHLYDMAEAVRRVAANVGGVDAIVAHSIGCLAAARALVDGVRARRLILLAPPRDLDSVVTGFGAALGLSAALVEEQRRRMETTFGPDVWRQFSFDELAPRLAVPGLVVVDRDDESVPSSQSDRVHLTWPGAEKMQTQGLGHVKLLRHRSVVERVAKTLARPA